MKVQIKFFASLAKYLPPGSGRRMAEMDIAEGTTAGELLEQLGVPVEMTQLIMVNGIHKDRAHALSEGETLGVFPPVAGGC